MKRPWVYMCSPSGCTLPPPSPPAPSRSSHCTRSERLSHASNLGWWSVSPLIVYMFRCCSLERWAFKESESLSNDKPFCTWFQQSLFKSWLRSEYQQLWGLPKERHFKCHLSTQFTESCYFMLPTALSVTCLSFVGTHGANERSGIPTQDFDFRFCILSFGPF